jgi:HTH-type transcriptional regulator/antitoxin HigA
METMSPVLDKATTLAWNRLEGLLGIYTEIDYRRTRRILDELVDEVGGDETHPKAALMDTLGILIAAWEKDHYAIPNAAPRKVLAYLMEGHGLRQGDMKEIGSQGVVSEILAGKRKLNLRQIQKLAGRFGVSPAVFV